MRDGVAITAYLVNESRRRRPDVAHDRLAAEWIPDRDRPAVRQLWEEFAANVYPYDDLVVSLRGRCVADRLATALRDDPDTVLVVCGAGFSSYPWLLPFSRAVEVDLPEIVTAKQHRMEQLRAAGIIDDREVTHIAADLGEETQRQQVIARITLLARGRPIAFVAEGLVFYIARDAARSVVGMGRRMDPRAVTIVSYWPASASDNPVLAAQRRWFRKHGVPEDATYLTESDLAQVLGSPIDSIGPQEQQRRYLGRVEVLEGDLIPEYLAVSLP